MEIMSDLVEQEKKNMEESIDFLTKELSKIRTGRANPMIVEDIQVEVYGSLMPIKQLATVTVADPQKLLIQPFDTNSTKEIIQAIINADVSPQVHNQGNAIFVHIAEMDGTRREQMKKKCNELSEETKIKIRNIRKNIRNIIKSDDSYTEDEKNKIYTRIDTQTNEYTSRSDNLSTKKEQELSNI